LLPRTTLTICLKSQSHPNLRGAELKTGLLAKVRMFGSILQVELILPEASISFSIRKVISELLAAPRILALG
jgi:hypothetical protein